MIFQEPLSEARRARSQFYYHMFSFINGISYMCLGEAVLILLAVAICMPNWVISALSAMIYTGYLMLMLGKYITSCVGAAKTQSLCWAIRNFAALLVASSVFLHRAGWQTAAGAVVLTGAFLFYGFRAAGVIMAQPLIGDISCGEDQGKFLSLNNALYFFSSVMTLVAVIFCLYCSESYWMLVGIIVFGALCGLTASGCLRRVDETAALRESARRPLRQDVISIAKSVSLRRQIAAGVAVNLAIILTTPYSLVALKKGYGIDDMRAMIFILIQFAASGLMSLATARINRFTGSRKMLIYSCAVLLAIPLFWLVAPEKFNWFCCAVPFIIAGAAFAANLNGTIAYFLLNVEQCKRVPVSMIVSLITGVGAGLLGTLLGNILLYFSSIQSDPEVPLSGYRIFFLCTFIVLIPCISVTMRLLPVGDEPKK